MISSFVVWRGDALPEELLTSGPAPGRGSGAVGFAVPSEGGAGPEAAGGCLHPASGLEVPSPRGEARGKTGSPFREGPITWGEATGLLRGEDGSPSPREGPEALGPPAGAAGGVGAAGAGGAWAGVGRRRTAEGAASAGPVSAG